MTRKHLISIAKKEIKMWRDLPDGLVMMILFAFVHRATTGETIEETFFTKQPPQPDYEI
jgi:hypothetical protein